jgi:ribosome-associated heat shock protein Hsp15
MAFEPAHSIEHGRPTKRDRRQIEHAWNARWSASADE